MILFSDPQFHIILSYYHILTAYVISNGDPPLWQQGKIWRGRGVKFHPHRSHSYAPHPHAHAALIRTTIFPAE